MPTRGLHRSITAHRSDLALLADWTALAAALDGRISQTDVLDVFLENQIYDDQDFGYEFVMGIWRELRIRKESLGVGLPIIVHEAHIETLGPWRDSPVYWFVHLLALGPSYGDWQHHGGLPSERGALFERTVAELVPKRFVGWTVIPSGWSGGAPNSLVDVVRNLGTATRSRQRDDEIAQWAGRSAKDAGLDLSWFLTFDDARGAYPIFLGQCASGDNWREKLSEPNLLVWERLLDFVSRPQQGVVIPFVLPADEFTRRANQVRGVLLDRSRLIPHDDQLAELDAGLRQDLVTWLDPRMAWLSRPD